MRKKEATSFRLTPEAIRIIHSLAKELGISQADVVELAVRKLAKSENAEEVKR